ncbi:MAG: 50S ribosomal protein L2 [Gemmataceae bacterium]
MGIRNYNPTSAGRRTGSVSDFADCTTPKVNAPYKPLLVRKRKTGGRNFQGIVTSRFRGGGHKQMMRVVDFKRKTDGVEATVLSVEYAPCRSARVALIEYANETKTKAYILAPDGLKAGDKVMSGDTAEPKPGNCLPLSKIPLGLAIHNIELKPGRGGQICRSAGCSATLGARDKGQVLITMPSGEVRRVSDKCRATVGSVSNSDHMNISLGKAGRVRWKGRKPHNRGMAMNPTDHPMGGGEGRSKSGGQPKGPSGVLAKGGKTRGGKKPSNSAIVRRRPAGPFQKHNG